MSSLILIGLLSLCAWFWIKNTRVRREKWLARLSLPGTWVCELPDGSATRLEFTGSVHQGTYVEYEGHEALRGAWHLESHILTLERAAGSLPVDIVLFHDGRVGMSRPSGAQRIYIKKQTKSNVVPLSSGKHP